MHDIHKKVEPIVLTNIIKEKAHMIPQGYVDAPILKDVEDPIRVKANWIANAWHCGVAISWSNRYFWDARVSRKAGGAKRYCRNGSPHGEGRSWTRLGCWCRPLVCYLSRYQDARRWDKQNTYWRTCARKGM